MKASGVASMKKILLNAFSAIERDTVEEIVGPEGTKKFAELAEDAFRFAHWLMRCSRTFHYQKISEFKNGFEGKTKQYQEILKEVAPERLKVFAREL